MTLSVKTIIGDICMTSEDGQKLHNVFRPSLDAGEVIVLDFLGTRVFVSAFFNAAFGQLLQKYSREYLRKMVILEHLPDAAKGPLGKAIANAERHYSDPRFQEALDRVLTHRAEIA